MLQYLFDNELWQRSDIEDLKRRVERNERFQRHRKEVLSKPADQRWETVSNEMAHMTLYCQTAVSLMIEKGLITPEEFVARMKQLDAADGKLDGKISQPKSEP